MGRGSNEKDRTSITFVERGEDGRRWGSVYSHVEIGIALGGIDKMMGGGRGEKSGKRDVCKEFLLDSVRRETAGGVFHSPRSTVPSISGIVA